MPVLLDMLMDKRLVLVDPTSWEDQNDAYLLDRYRQLGGFKTLLALCFTTKPESFHHWKVFAGGMGGVCVQFDPVGLKACFANDAHVRMECVSYKAVKDVERKTPKRDELPFLKRLQFRDEGEFRVIFSHRELGRRSEGFHLDLACIRMITLSPWTTVPVLHAVQQVIHGIQDCGGIKINRSAALDHTGWRSVADRVS